MNEVLTAFDITVRSIEESVDNMRIYLNKLEPNVAYDTRLELAKIEGVLEFAKKRVEELELNED